MNENAKKGVAALRSGEYEQGKGNLRDIDDCYCCLGVGTDVYCRETENGGWEQDREFGWYKFGSGDDAKTNTLPRDAVKWLGVSDSAGHFEKKAMGDMYTDADEVALWFLNDVKGMSFAEIADVIEPEPPGLFVEKHAAGNQPTACRD